MSIVGIRNYTENRRFSESSSFMHREKFDKFYNCSPFFLNAIEHQQTRLIHDGKHMK